MSKNFLTNKGLKIRLNTEYFYYQLTKSDEPVSQEDLVENEKLSGAVSCIENMFCIPTALVQFFAIISFIFHFDIPLFCGCSIALYAFGCLWRCCKQDYILSNVLFIISFAYNHLRYLVYIALIALCFALKSTYLIVPYLAVRVFLFIFDFIQNMLILSYTRKKYGFAFNDTEICAFRVFKLLTQTGGTFTAYIKDYLSAIKDETTELSDVSQDNKSENRIDTVNSMLKCSHCGNQLPSDAKYCNICGKTVTTEKKNAQDRPKYNNTTEYITCRHCGNKIPEDSNFCKVCGRIIPEFPDDGRVHYVGQILPNFIGHSGGSQIDVSEDGIMLKMILPNVTEEEIQAHESLRLRMRVKKINNAVWFTFNFNDTGWADAPFSLQLANLQMPMQVRKYLGCLRVLLIDSVDGKVCAMTEYFWTENFTSVVSTFMLETFVMPFDKDEYFKMLSSVMSRLTPEQIANQSVFEFNNFPTEEK